MMLRRKCCGTSSLAARISRQSHLVIKELVPVRLSWQATHGRHEVDTSVLLHRGTDGVKLGTGQIELK